MTIPIPVPGEHDDDRWLAHFRAAGHDGASLIGGGVEGRVFRLGDGLVAKVWHAAPVGQVRLLAEVYAEVADAGPALATPLVHSVDLVDGTVVSTERELPGVSLQSVLPPGDGPLPAFAVDALGAALDALRRVPPVPALHRLPVVVEDRPFRTGDGFVADLVALLGRRLALDAGRVAALVPDLDERVADVCRRLEGLDPVPDTLLHGDLFGQNLLVDEHRAATAVLDFGFMTTAGDPRFEAAVTAAIADMYGPSARVTTETLTRELAERLGYDPAVLEVYREAYAVATSTVFGGGPQDGHLRWCADVIARAARTP